MIGGFLKGALTGFIVAGLIAGTASVLSDPPAQDGPETGEVEQPPERVDASHEDHAPTRRERGGTQDRAPSASRDIGSAGRLGDGETPETGRESGARQDDPVTPEPDPQMSDAPGTDLSASSAGSEDDADEIPALQRNAETFEAPRDKPLLALLLIETEDDPVSFETLESFPYPLSIALRSENTDAAENAARYRAAGFEVVLTVDLPRDAAPADIRTALRSRLSQVPQAVAVLNEADTGLPAGAAPILAQTGHGLLSRGAQAGAARDLLTLSGVPAARLQHDLEAQAQDVDAIRDALDEAADSADRRGVIVLGRTRADTLRALSLWSGQGGARRVTLAPVSAVLNAQADTPAP